MAKSNTVLWSLAALALGVGVTYAVLVREAKAAPKKSKPPIPDQPPIPGGPDASLPGAPSPGTGIGVGYYRDPMPNVQVAVPTGTEEYEILDAEICATIEAFETTPEPSEIALTVLEVRAPQAQWPTVPGDNPTLIALQTLVGFRVNQVATSNPNKTPQENLTDFCLPSAHFDPAPGG